MTGSYLLAQTSRAGAGRAVKTNHRYLISAGTSRSETLVVALLGQAVDALGPVADHVIGGDYIAVIRRGVFQLHDDRLGNEVLLLGGIATDRLGARRESIVKRLQARLEQLRGVVDGIDWTSEMLVESPTLRQWLREDFADVPASSSRKPLLVGMLLGALAALVLVGVLWAAGPLDGLKNQLLPSREKPKNGDPRQDDSRALLEKWLKAAHGKELAKFSPQEQKAIFAELHFLVYQKEERVPADVLADARVRSKLNEVKNREYRVTLFLDRDSVRGYDELDSVKITEALAARRLLGRFTQDWEKLRADLAKQPAVRKLDQAKVGVIPRALARLAGAGASVAEEGLGRGIQGYQLPFLRVVELEEMKRAQKTLDRDEVKDLLKEGEVGETTVLGRLRDLGKAAKELTRRTKKQKEELPDDPEKDQLDVYCNAFVRFLQRAEKWDSPQP